MKITRVVFIALAALLIIPGVAMADTFTYAGSNGTVSGLIPYTVIPPLAGSGSFSTTAFNGGLPVGQTSFFSFLSPFLGGTGGTFDIGLTSGASDLFFGSFTSGFSGLLNCIVGSCAITADVAGVSADHGGESLDGTVTLDLRLEANGNWQVTGSDVNLYGANAVPEPGTLAMFAIGLMGIGLMISRKAKTLSLSA
jgi:PEP-CTERM motif